MCTAPVPVHAGVHNDPACLLQSACKPVQAHARAVRAFQRARALLPCGRPIPAARRGGRPHAPACSLLS
eukprot:4725007-Pleurochrysis_carterae.AAC.1